MLSLINPYEALIDACVLAPMPVCDTLLRLAEEPAIYVPRWSKEILVEVRSTLKKMGYSTAQSERRIKAMEEAFPEAEVVGYEYLISEMPNHPKDRHVLAAAIRCNADVIITENIKHFPDKQLQFYDLEAITADDFLVHQYHLEPDLLFQKLKDQAADQERPLSSLLDLLARRSAPRFALLIAKHNT